MYRPFHRLPAEDEGGAGGLIGGGETGGAGVADPGIGPAGGEPATVGPPDADTDEYGCEEAGVAS